MANYLPTSCQETLTNQKRSTKMSKIKKQKHGSKINTRTNKRNNSGTMITRMRAVSLIVGTWGQYSDFTLATLD
jgi:hypothetical protein